MTAEYVTCQHCGSENVWIGYAARCWSCEQWLPTAPRRPGILRRVGAWLRAQ